MHLDASFLRVASRIPVFAFLLLPFLFIRHEKWAGRIRTQRLSNAVFDQTCCILYLPLFLVGWRQSLVLQLVLGHHRPECRLVLVAIVQHHSISSLHLLMLALLSISLQFLRVELFDWCGLLRAGAEDGRLWTRSFRGHILLYASIIIIDWLLHLIVAIVDMFQGSVVLICLRLIHTWIHCREHCVLNCLAVVAFWGGWSIFGGGCLQSWWCCWGVFALQMRSNLLSLRYSSRGNAEFRCLLLLKVVVVIAVYGVQVENCRRLIDVHRGLTGGWKACLANFQFLRFHPDLLFFMSVRYDFLSSLRHFIVSLIIINKLLFLIEGFYPRQIIKPEVWSTHSAIWFTDI